MAKKHKKKLEQAQKKTMEAGGEEEISSRGWRVIGAGVGLLAAGFFVLTLTDPKGRNWASNLAPLMILGAYAVIAWGIFLPDPAPAQPPSPPDPSAAPR